jgi:acetolactate synthase-1/2/3 large subunit
MLGIIDRFTSFIEGKTHESWHNKFKELYEIELEAVINEELKPKKEFQWETIEMINKHSKGDAIMVSDGTTPNVYPGMPIQFF